MSDPTGVLITDKTVASVRALYDRGLCLHALSEAQAAAPLQRWRGTAARIVAGRLAANVGAVKLSNAHDWLAFREDPTNPDAIENEARRIYHRLGPWFAIDFIRRYGELNDASPRTQAWWLATHGVCAATLRDFDTAERMIAQAEKLAPEDPWTRVEHATALERQDRYADALAMTVESMRLRPWYRAGAQHRAHLLCLLDRDHDAHDLLEEASHQIENMWIVNQLAELQLELGRYAQARENFERVIALAPLLEKESLKWIRARRSDVAYYCGDFPTAARLAAEADTPFHKKMAEKLAQPDPAQKRVLLPVSFVRQHHMTCAPATLSAISRYWSMPTDHLNIVEEICYDGTPAYSERNWAQSHGYEAREFTVTYESAVALIDRGIPFTLTTVHPTSAHLQAVIGYDGHRQTLLIRDPYQRHHGEFLIDSLMENQRSTGPRGMVLVPEEKVSLLDDVKLPDIELYDHFHDLNGALQKHDRVEAENQRRAMVKLDANHRLTIWADRALASYDADTAGSLRAVERLLEMYPKDDFLQLWRLSHLRALTRRADVLSVLAELCDKPSIDPVFRQQYAQELSADAREDARARRLLRRALRQRPVESSALFILAQVLWHNREFEPATMLYRFASCLADKDEHLALTFFNVMRCFKRTEEALSLLRSRLERNGAKSSQPAMSLFRALASIARFDEGFATLEKAIQTRPNDGMILTFAADEYARHGRFDRATALLESARGKVKETTYLRSVANLAVQRGDVQESRRLWVEILEKEPLAIDALRSAVYATAEASSRAEATQLLYRTAERFPHQYDVHRFLVDWLRNDDDPETLEAAIAHLIEIHPVDSWAHQQMAVVKQRRGQHVEALAAAEMGVQLEPTNSESHATLAAVFANQSKVAEAEASCRRAIELSVDCDPAIRQLMDLTEDPRRRREALAFVKSELEKQVIFGQGLLLYRYYASATLDAAEILTGLREAHAARPDLWQAWCALVRQLVDSNLLDEAHELASKATEHFPLVAQLWIDLSYVCRLKAHADGERRALERAVEISPAWIMPRSVLVGMYDRAGDLEKARTIAQEMVRIFPLEADGHLQLASLLWRLEQREPALQHIELALQIDPGNDRAWVDLREWSEQLKRPTLAVDLARKLCERRPGEVRSWLVLSRVLSEPAQLDERLAALDRATVLSPLDTDTHDMRAWLLASAGRFDEAVAACKPAALGDSPPIRLRGREAWIEARRGNLDRALEQMQRVVADDPKYLWAIHQLGEWHCQKKDLVAYEKVAEQLIRISPHDATSFGTLGHALELQKKIEPAKAAYRRSIEVDPAYRWGAMSLFDLEVRNDHAGAKRTLEILKKHIGDDYVKAREVQFLEWTGHADQALKLFEDIASRSKSDLGPTQFAFNVLRNAGVWVDLERTLLKICKDARASEHVGSMWAEIVCDRKAWKELSRGLLTISRAGEQQDKTAASAAFIYMKRLAKLQLKSRLNRFLSKQRDWLREHDVTWAEGSFCYATTAQYRRGIEWTNDWAQRSGVEQWVLTNRMICLLQLGRDSEAIEVARHAVTLADTGRHHVPKLWLALHEALEGSAQAATDRVNSLSMEGAFLVDELMRKMVDVLTGLLAHNGQDKALKLQMKSARQSLASVRNMIRLSANERPYRRFFMRTVKKVVSVRPTFGMRVWAAFQRVWILWLAASTSR